MNLRHDAAFFPFCCKVICGVQSDIWMPLLYLKSGLKSSSQKLSKQMYLWSMIRYLDTLNLARRNFLTNAFVEYNQTFGYNNLTLNLALNLARRNFPTNAFVEYNQTFGYLKLTLNLALNLARRNFTTNIFVEYNQTFGYLTLNLSYRNFPTNAYSASDSSVTPRRHFGRISPFEPDFGK